MSRPLRIEFEGAWYHVMNRGASRQAIFKTDAQRQHFLSLLAEASSRFNAEWHAYCLMGNHYHLMLRTPEANLQRIMRHINGLYTQYYNRSERRDGPLFRGRYKAILVEAPTYWARLSRYIHRNPLDAGLVDDLIDYPWSSYPAYIDRQPIPDWLECNYILSSLATSDVHVHYQAYVADASDKELQTFYRQKTQTPILASDIFKATLGLKKANPDIPALKSLRAVPSVEQIAEAVSRHLDVPPDAIWISKRGRGVDSPARAMAMYLCQEIADMKLGDIAEWFSLKNYTSAGSGIRQFRQRLASESQLQEKIKLIKLDLTS
ncbi:MAG: transposase [Pseudomonadota bacterium]